MLSNLSPKLKIKLDEQRTISMGLKKYLRLEEQVSHLITLYWDLYVKHYITVQRKNRDSMWTIFQGNMAY